jgi:2-polyprenyl-6-methoxyphenol hydroxylase-like FAD-dependent oxidoreductase
MSGDVDSRRRSGNPRVLVVGAGIGGLGVARALALRGITADVVEREPRWDQAGAGIYLPGNAMRALRALGLASAVSSSGAQIPHQRICDDRGNLLTEIDLAHLWGDVGPCVALHRSDLHDVLLSYGDGVPVRMGLPVVRLHQQRDVVTVEFGDGTAGEYDLVVGADGVHSTVRHLIFGTGAIRPLGQRAWRFVTRCPVEVKTWTVYLGREVTFLAVPIGRGQVYCYCDAKAGADTRRSGDAVTEQLAELLADFAGPVPAILDSIGRETAVHVGPIEEVAIDRWRHESVLLIGDAAHATSPNMAEGAAMALEDGLVLAECLASERLIPQALARFEAKRGPRTRWVRAQTRRRDRTRSLPPVVRNLVLRRWGRQIFHHNYRPLLDLP